jgi:predicted PurR-regulated permease PerM
VDLIRYNGVVNLRSLNEHFQITRDALRSWLIAQAYDALIVGLIWLAGLLLIGVPFAPLWALVAALFQFVPLIGTVFALIGPLAAGLITGGGTLMLYVLVLYAFIALLDGFVLQPLLVRRTARVPVWASILAPLVLGALLNVWGVVLSIPLLAVIYAYRARPWQAP